MKKKQMIIFSHHSMLIYIKNWHTKANNQEWHDKTSSILMFMFCS